MIPITLHDRMHPKPVWRPLGCQHRQRVDITDYSEGHDTAMCNDCGARWSVIPEWRLADRLTCTLSESDA